jgi:hypothetical protein
MGPNAALRLFKHFEDAPDQYKRALAPNALLIAQDTLAKLECSTEDCDDLRARKEAAQYMIDYLQGYIPDLIIV